MNHEIRGLDKVTREQIIELHKTTGLALWICKKAIDSGDPEEYIYHLPLFGDCPDLTKWIEEREK